jgi:hypothetical protein
MELRERGDALKSLDKGWQEIGRGSAAAYLERSTWLFRRIESIEFVERSAVRRRVSVDFHMPETPDPPEGKLAEKVRLVPLSTTPKWPPLAQFSLWGADGAPASLYRRDTNKALDFGLLTGVVDGICRDAGSDPMREDLREWLATLVCSDQPPKHAVQRIIGDMREFLAAITATRSDERLAERAAQALDLAGLLATSSMLWVPVQAAPRQDCIVKFSYLDRIQHKGRRWSWRRVLASFGWREQAVFISLPHSGLHTRYHLEVLAPPGAGIEIMAARTLAFPGATMPTARAAAAQPKPASPPPEPEPGEPTASARVVDRRVHIYHPVRVAPSHRMFVQLRWAASRAGYVTGCWLSAALIALAMTAGLAGLPQVADGVDPTIVLFAVVPVVLGYVLIKPAEHVLEREYVVGVRFMALITGAIPIIAALVLIFCKQDGEERVSVDTVRPWWVALTIASWILVTGLTMSWAFAADGEDSSRDRRWTSAAPLAGLVAGVALILGSIVGERQPYAVVMPDGLRQHLLDHQARILIGAACLWIGAVALWTFLGGTWRVVSKASYRPPRSRRRAVTVVGNGGSPATQPRTEPLRGLQRDVARTLTVGMGALWMVATAVAGVLSAYQVLTVGDSGAERRLARGIDIAANATLIPAGVLVIATTWLLVARQLSRRPADVDKPHLSRFQPRQMSERRAKVILGVATALVLGLIILRGFSALSHGRVVDLPPSAAWSAFGVWVVVVAGLTWDLRGELSPI